MSDFDAYFAEQDHVWDSERRMKHRRYMRKYRQNNPALYKEELRRNANRAWLSRHGLQDGAGI